MRWLTGTAPWLVFVVVALVTWLGSVQGVPKAMAAVPRHRTAGRNLPTTIFGSLLIGPAPTVGTLEFSAQQTAAGCCAARGDATFTALGTQAQIRIKITCLEVRAQQATLSGPVRRAEGFDPAFQTNAIQAVFRIIDGGTDVPAQISWVRLEAQSSALATPQCVQGFMSVLPVEAGSLQVE